MERPDDRLLNGLEHVLFEIQQLGFLQSWNPDPPGGFLENVKHVAMLMHIRNLYAFFSNLKSPNKDDIGCDDYDWPATSGLTEHRPLIDRIHKDVAHLTYDRNARPEGKRDWHLDIVPDLMQLAARFATKCAVPRLPQAHKLRRAWEAIARVCPAAGQASDVAAATHRDIEQPRLVLSLKSAVGLTGTAAMTVEPSPLPAACFASKPPSSPSP